MEYFRKIIYLNEYDGGNCGASIGYAKVSKKQNQMKLEINLSEERALRGKKVYLLDKDKNAVNKLLFGTITEDGREITMSAGMGEAGMIKGKLAGILIGGEGSVVCAGIEDDSVRIADYVGTGREEKKKVQNESEYTEHMEARRVSEESRNPETERKPEESVAAQEEAPGQHNGEVISEGEEEEEIIQVEIEEEHDTAYQLNKIFRTHTAMYPFEDDEMDECVQIMPADFSNFPKEYWHMGSNTFLLQGFYNYRHLLMARKGGQILVGIPGQYHRRDKYLADMFGFGRFKNIHRRQERLGDFGYWMQEIVIPPASDSMVCVPETGSVNLQMEMR